MKIVSVINQKGGVGKTTTVINLGAALTLMGKKVLLIDLDPQGNMSAGLNISPEEIKDKNSYQALVGHSSVIENVCDSQVEGLFVMPADSDLAGAEVELVGLQNREYRLREAFTEECSVFDYILIDCPPSLGLLTLNALTASNSFLIPMQSEFFALQGLTNIIRTAELVKGHLNPQLSEEGVLLTMFDSRSNLSKQVYQEIKNYTGDRLFKNMIPRRVRLAESTSHGIPGVIYDPTCMGSRSYIEVAKEFVLRTQGLRIWDESEKEKTTFLPPDPVDRIGKEGNQGV